MATQVSDLLGGERVLGAAVKSNLDLVRATRDGLPGEALRLLDEALGAASATVGDLAHGWRDLPFHQAAAKLTPAQSDMVFRTACVFAKAIDVLGDRRKAAHWLTSGNRALGGEAPASLLDTSAGMHEIETLLERIDHGVYS